MALRSSDVLIDDETISRSPWLRDHVMRYKPDGIIRATGAVPRDWDVQPPTPEQVRGDAPAGIPEIPESEWSERLKELEAEKALLSDIRNTGNNGAIIDCLDQGPVGYCWAHSLTHAITMQRAVANHPYEPLSAYSIAAVIKNGADEGGWSPHAAEFAEKYGVCSQAIWPQGDRNVKARWNDAAKADALKRRMTEGWLDTTRREWDRHINFRQMASLLLSGQGSTLDLSWWGHSVFGLDLVEVEPGSFGVRILNSWGMAWGEKGTSVLRGSKAQPDLGSCSVRVTRSVFQAA